MHTTSKSENFTLRQELQTFVRSNQHTNTNAFQSLRSAQSMACAHGFSSRACQHPGCSTPATAVPESIAESDPSTESDSSEESESGSGSAEGYESSDEVAAVVDNMTSTNLAVVGISHLLYPFSLHRVRIHMTVG